MIWALEVMDVKAMSWKTAQVPKKNGRGAGMRENRRVTSHWHLWDKKILLQAPEGGEDGSDWGSRKLVPRLLISQSFVGQQGLS
jgi:hypothetical protein